MVASIGFLRQLKNSHSLVIYTNPNADPFERQVQFGSSQRLLHWHNNNYNTYPVNYQFTVLNTPTIANWGGYLWAALEASTPYCTLVIKPSLSAYAECSCMLEAGWSRGLLSWHRRDETTGHSHHCYLHSSFKS